MEIRNLNPFGKEILYFDFDSDLEQISELFLSSQILVLRNKDPVSNDDFIKLCSKLGTILKNKDQNLVAEESGSILRISNVNGILGNNELDWHNDFSGKPGNYHGASLYSVQNADKSNTTWCDTRRAYNDLDNKMKEKLSNAIGQFFLYPKFEDKESQPYAISPAEIRFMKQKGLIERPLVPIHPKTGSKSLYVSPFFLVDYEPKDFDMDDLIAHCNKPKYLYSHSWREYDLILFDNLSTMHRRDDAFGGVRTLHRIQFNYF